MKDKVFFENLDTLRTLACFSVFASHSILSKTLQNLWDNPHYQRFISFAGTGAIGVSFFFVLSGFLITYLILLEDKKHQKINIQKFYVRRLLRIWPLYYFVVVFGFFIYPLFKQLIGMETTIANVFVYYLFFLSNFDVINLTQKGLVGLSPMMLNIIWSVSIEEQFYLFWPILFIFTSRKYYKYIFIVIIFCNLLFISLHQSNQGNVLYFHTFAVMGDLALGGLCAYYALLSTRFISFFENLPRQVIIIVYVLGILLIMYSYDINLPYFLLYKRLLITCFFSFIILEQNYSKNSLLKYGKIKLLSKMGKYTYSMYMLHPIGIQTTIILYRFLKVKFDDNFYYSMLYIILAFIISCFISYISYHYYESYFLKLKDKYQVTQNTKNTKTAKLK